jgi:hypothetical protein
LFKCKYPTATRYNNNDAAGVGRPEYKADDLVSRDWERRYIETAHSYRSLPQTTVFLSILRRFAQLSVDAGWKMQPVSQDCHVHTVYKAIVGSNVVNISCLMFVSMKYQGGLRNANYADHKIL